jgi:hypothetical protein
MAQYSKDTSPVGWYVGSYQIRFIELDALGNDDQEGEFLVWENTVIVKAASFDEAYDKVAAVGSSDTAPYKGGPDGIPVQWVFEGITELLPIYEPLEDGAEIMWAEHEAVKLSKLKSRARSLGQLKKPVADKRA